MSVGTFTPNHVGFEAVRELARVVVPGGLVLLALRDDFVADPASAFEAHLGRLTAPGGVLELVHVTNREVYTPNVSADITFRCWTWRRK